MANKDEASQDKGSKGSAARRRSSPRRRRGKSGSKRLPAALTASAVEEEEAEEGSSRLRKDRSRADRRRKLQARREAARRTSRKSSDDNGSTSDASAEESTDESPRRARKRRSSSRSASRAGRSSKSQEKSKDKTRESRSGDDDDSDGEDRKRRKRRKRRDKGQDEGQDEEMDREKDQDSISEDAVGDSEMSDSEVSDSEMTDSEATDSEESGSDETSSASSDLTSSGRKSKRSKRLKSKLRRKRRRKKKRKAEESGSSVDEPTASEIEELGSDEISTVETPKPRKRPKVKSKSAGEGDEGADAKGVAPASEELENESWDDAEGREVVKGLAITLDPPAKAKRVAEQARAEKGEQADEVEEVAASTRKGKKASKLKKKSKPAKVVEDVEEIEEVEEVPAKGKKTSKLKKKSKPAKVVEDVEEIEEVEEVPAKGKKTSKLKKKSKPAKVVEDVEEIEELPARGKKASKLKKKTKAAKVVEDIEEVEDVEEIEEIPAKGKTSKLKKKTKAAKVVEDIADDEVEELPAKGSSKSKDDDSKKSKGRTRGKSRDKSKDDDETSKSSKGPGKTRKFKKGGDSSKPTRKTGKAPEKRERATAGYSPSSRGGTPVMPILVMGGLIVGLVGVLAVVASNGGESARLEIAKLQDDLEERRKNQLESALAQSKQASKLDTAEVRLRSLLLVYQNSRDTTPRQRAMTAIRELEEKRAERARHFFEKLTGEARAHADEGRIELALKTMDKFPLEFRGTAVWQDEATKFIDELTGGMSAEAEGRPLIIRANKLFEDGEFDRALGVLAGLSKAHDGTAIADEVEKLKSEISSARARKLEAERERALAMVKRKVQEARAAVEQAKLDEILKKEDEGKWQPQTGKNLFPWQIRSDYDKNTRIFKLNGRTLTIDNKTGQPQVLGRNRTTWKSYVVRFDVKLEQGSWEFIAKLLMVNSKGRQTFAAVLDPIQKKDQWVSVKIYCIRNEFWQMVDGEKKTLVPNENDAKEVGGFGFRVSAGGRISVRNIEALVLEEK